MGKVKQWFGAHNPVTWLMNENNFLALVVSGVVLLFTMGIAIVWLIVALLCLSLGSFWVQVGFIFIFWAAIYKLVRAYIDDESPTNDAEDDDG
jgi:membrane protein implicated in regulation of membrane protease activity